MALTISPDVATKVPDLLAVCIVFGVLVTATLLLRLSARLWILKVPLGWDDYTIIIAGLLSIYFCINVPQQTSYGLGHHLIDLTVPTYFSGSLKLFFFGELVYYIIVTFTKISLLFLYLRIFVQRPLILLTWGLMAFVTLTMVAFVFAIVFQCSPVQFAWDKTISGTCVNQIAIFYSHAGINIVVDFIIYIMPMKMLWGVKRAKQDKIGLMIVFSMGIFVCTAGIIRLWALQKTSISTDPSWDNVPSAIWSIIECCVGVICASAPSLKPLFSSASRKMNSSIRLSEGNNLGSGKANTKDLEGRQRDNNVKISGSCPNAKHHSNGSTGSPTDSVKSLVGQNPPVSHDDKSFAVYTSKTVSVRHEDGKYGF